MSKLDNIQTICTFSECAPALSETCKERIKDLMLEIIGEDRPYKKLSECPNGCGYQYSCRCCQAESNIKAELRQKVSEL